MKTITKEKRREEIQYNKGRTRVSVGINKALIKVNLTVIEEVEPQSVLRVIQYFVHCNLIQDEICYY